jgi:hypothetical protein
MASQEIVALIWEIKGCEEVAEVYQSSQDKNKSLWWHMKIITQNRLKLLILK